MISFLIKIFYFILELLYMCFNAVVVWFVYSSVGNGVFGLPASVGLAFVAAFLTLLVLIIPGCLVVRMRLRKKDLDDK